MPCLVFDPLGLLFMHFLDKSGLKYDIFLTHYQTKNLDSSSLKEFADHNFKFDENGRKLSKRVENTVGKGEIARYEQFLLFPQCFQKACLPGASKGVIVWEWVNLIYPRIDQGHIVLLVSVCPSVCLLKT